MKIDGLTTPELAQHLGVSVESVYAWIRRGLKAPPRKRFGREGGPPRIWQAVDVARAESFKKTLPKRGGQPGNRNRQSKDTAHNPSRR